MDDPLQPGSVNLRRQRIALRPFAQNDQLQSVQLGAGIGKRLDQSGKVLGGHQTPHCDNIG